MQNPDQVSDIDGEWFEIRNHSDREIDLLDLEVWDLGTDFFAVTSSVLLPSGGYAVFGVEANDVLNGGAPVDVAFTYIVDRVLENGADEL